MAKKTTCPISRNQFREHAKPIVIQIGDETLEADVKEFATGSLGWYLNCKIKVDVGGIKVPVQVGLNLTIVGSKELADGGPAHAGQAVAQQPATTAADDEEEE